MFRAEYEPYFFHLERNLNRTLHLAQNMMEIARFEAGTDEYPQKNGIIRQALEEMLAQARLSAAEYGVNLTLLPGPDVCGSYQPEPFEHVMLNLLTNAVRHSPRGTGLVQVKLDMECVSGQAVCKVGVLDNGPGIAPGDEGAPF